MRKKLTAIMIAAIILIVILSILQYKIYTITDVEINNEFVFINAEEKVLTRDKVNHEGDWIIFFETTDNKFGSLHYKKGLNKRYKLESVSYSETYYQIVYPIINNEQFVIIVGHNPLDSEISCEIKNSFISNGVNIGDFMLIFGSVKKRNLPFEPILFVDEESNDITYIIKEI